MTIYYADVEHNDEMTSFIVKDWQPLSVLKMLNAQAMHIRFFGGKMKNAYCTVWAEVVDFFSFSSFHKEMLPLL